MTASDNEHVHTFEPWEGEMGVYRCACGASGYRRDGEVVAHKKQWTRHGAPSVRPVGDEAIDGGARVAPKKGTE